MAPVTTVLGIDIGATKIAAAIVDPTRGTVTAEAIDPTPLGATPSEQLAACVALAERVTASLPVDAVGIGLCELVDPGGEIRSAESLDWRSLDIERAFAHFGPVTIESDVRAAALAEASHGAGRNLSSFLYVNAGSGTSSCFVVEGRPHRGVHGAAILIGGAPLNAEVTAGGTGIAAQFGAGTVQDVVAAAAAGETRAVDLLQTGGAVLGRAIGFAVNLLDPEAIIVGGGLVLNVAIYRAALERSLRETIWADDVRSVPLVEAALGVHAGVVGAAVAASQRTLAGVS